MSDVKDPVQIAVSYSRADAAKVEPLLEALRAEGLSVWFDKDIPGGTLWEEIYRAQNTAPQAGLRSSSAGEPRKPALLRGGFDRRTLNKPIFPILIEKLKLPDELRIVSC